uniref:tRNA pseudouridine(55) synthase n=1 Tax=Theileria annulata TaxID=5874 RepID=A0A3B0MG72_THEAN
MSVEKCIGLPLKKILDAEEYKLIGAGREDINVRNLGNGRKMALELKNTSIDPFLFLYAIDNEDLNGRYSKDLNGRLSKDTNGRLSEDPNGRLCEDTNGRISNPTDSVTLYHKNIKIDYEKILLADKKLIKDYFIESDERDLDPRDLDRRDLDEKDLDPIMDNIVVKFKNVKMTINCRIECQKIHYEIDKHTKSYNCLIYSENLLTHDEVNVINGLKFPILIKQKNPIRISHRRSQDTRNRQILELKLDLIHPRILLMYIKTQSGKIMN